MIKESMSGRESTGLALIARYPNNKKVVEKVLSVLTGTALKVGKAILDKNYRCSKDVRECANHMIDWANSLGH